MPGVFAKKLKKNLAYLKQAQNITRTKTSAA